MSELKNKHKKKEKNQGKKKREETETERKSGRDSEPPAAGRGSRAGGPAEGQAWTGGGDGWRAHQFLKAKAGRAAESVKFTLLISCNNL